MENCFKIISSSRQSAPNSRNNVMHLTKQMSASNNQRAALIERRVSNCKQIVWARNCVCLNYEESQTQQAAHRK